MLDFWLASYYGVLIMGSGKLKLNLRLMKNILFMNPVQARLLESLFRPEGAEKTPLPLVLILENQVNRCLIATVNCWQQFKVQPQPNEISKSKGNWSPYSFRRKLEVSSMVQNDRDG